MRCLAARTTAALRGRLWCRPTASMPPPEAPAVGPVRRKQVVTAFVQRPADGAVLVVLRSDKVGTYKQMWGAVSGGIEGEQESPVFRCGQEILEEAGLTSSQVQLVRSGRPLVVDDGRLHFNIHPFLFQLTQPDADAAVTLNWENDDFRWVNPSAICSLPAVPLLAETYERLELSDRQAVAVQRLVEDRQHGAAQLAQWALEALEEEAAAAAAEAAARAVGSESRAEGAGPRALDGLRNFGYHLACCRPSMAPIANAVAAALAAGHEELHARADAFEVPLGEACGIVQMAAAAERQRLEGVAAELRRQAAGLLRDGMTVMTTSLSSTILTAVRDAAESGMRLKAVVCEARPLCEGVQLAAAWAEAGVEVTVITDAQAGLFVQQADLVLVGADAITKTAAVNKSGTYLLALAARAAGVPMYAVADSGKLSPGTLFAMAHPGGQKEVEQQGEEEKEAEEVTAAWGRDLPPGCTVRNVYFEPTPLDLLAGLVTEGGMLEASSIGAALEQRRQQYRVAFQLPR